MCTGAFCFLGEPFQPPALDSSPWTTSKLPLNDVISPVCLIGSDRVAILKTRSDSTQDTRYVHTDHLGSIDTVTDDLGVVVERLAYDAHGKRRQVDWLDSPITIIAQETPRGFTDHENLDQLGLVHMNGRVYDPTLGRFLSADPFVQYPESTQGLNRYTYVNNNDESCKLFFSIHSAPNIDFDICRK